VDIILRVHQRADSELELKLAMPISWCVGLLSFWHFSVLFCLTTKELCRTRLTGLVVPSALTDMRAD
jgi:hypothetical protein